MAYNPSLFIAQNIPFAPSDAPLNAKSLFYDAVNNKFRAFLNVAEVNAYFDLAEYRDPTFDVIVNTGGVLSGGIITGGTNSAYWYRDGSSDSDLRLKTNSVDLTGYYTKSEINLLISGLNSSLDEHINNHSNPHETTKQQIGLGNVDNTSDINKPVSTAQQFALSNESNLRASADNILGQRIDANTAAISVERERAISVENTKADSIDIISPVTITYADLSGNTYTNPIFANQQATLIYYDNNAILQLVFVSFNSSGIITLPFTAGPTFKGRIDGTSGLLGNYTALSVFNQLKNYVQSRIVSYGATDALNTYTTAGATNRTNINKAPLVEQSTLSSIELWATSAGNINLRLYTGNGLGQITQYKSILIPITVGLNSILPSVFGEIVMSAGSYIGHYVTGTAGGGVVGRKSRTAGGYEIAGATTDGTTYNLPALANNEFGIKFNFTPVAIQNRVEKIESILYGTTDPVIKKSNFDISGTNLFSTATINGGLVNSSGNISTTPAGWRYARFVLDPSKTKIYASSINVRPNLTPSAYWRFYDASLVTVQYGSFNSGQALALDIPVGAVGFDIDVRSNFETNDEGYKYAYIGYSAQTLNSFLGIPFGTSSGQSTVSNAERLAYRSTRQAIFSFIFDDLNPSDQNVYNIFKEYGFRPNFALIGDNLNSGNAAVYLNFWKDGCSILDHSVSHDNIFNNSSTPSSTINSQMVNAKSKINNFGILTNGWVTPYSILNSVFYPLVDRIFGYSFVKAPGGAYDQTVAPNRLSRYSIESNDLDTIKAFIDTAITNNLLVTFYAHTLPATNLNEAKLRDIIAYLKTKSDNYECLVLNTDDAVKTYYTQTYSEKFPSS